MSILSDQNLMNDIMSYDPQRIQNNPKMMQLLNNPSMKALMEKIQGKTRLFQGTGKTRTAQVISRVFQAGPLWANFLWKSEQDVF